MFNWLDYALIVFFIVGAVFGLLQGYKWQLYRLGCLILAYFLSWYFCNSANQFLSKFTNTQDRNFIGYTVLFFSTLIITFFVGAILLKLQGGNQGRGKLAGATIGIFRNVIFCCILITYLWLLGSSLQREPINNSAIATKLRTTTFSAIYKLPFDFLYTAKK